MPEEEKIISIRVKTDTNERQLGELEESIKQVTKARADLLKQVRVGESLSDKERKQIGELTALQGRLNKKRTETKKSLDDLNKSRTTAVKSYDSLTQRNAKLAKELRKLGDPLGKNKVKFKQLSSEIKSNTGELSKMDEAQGRFQRNVGNYPDLLGQISPALGGVINGLKGMVTASLAFIATPLGATLAVIAALAAPLVAFFTKTERGMEFVERAAAGLSATFDVLVDRLSSIGEAMSLIFSGDIQKGLTQLKGSFKGITEEIEKESKAALELERRYQELEDRKREFRVEEAKTQLLIKQAEALANNEDFTAQQRLARIEEARTLNAKLAAERIGIAKEELAIKSEQIALGETLDEELDEQTDLIVALIQVEEQQANIEKRLVSQRKTLTKQALAENVEFELKAIEDLNQAKEDDLLDQLDDIEDFYEKEEEALVAQGDRLFKEEQKQGLERQKLAEEQQKAKDEVVKAAAVAGLNAIDDAINESFRRKNTALDNQAKKEISILDKKLNNQEISEEQYKKEVDKIREAQFEQEKKNAIIQNTLNSAVAFMVSAATYGFTPALGVAGAGLGAALIAQNAIVSSSQYEPLEFADGGLLQGNSHANGGIPMTINGQRGYEAEGGEAIINKRSTAMFTPLLSAINQAGGGVGFESPIGLSKFALGGIARANSTQAGFDSRELINAVNRRIDTIKVVNVASDTAAVANRVSNIQSDASFG